MNPSVDLRAGFWLSRDPLLTLPINTWSGQHGYIGSWANTVPWADKYPAMNASVIEQPTDGPRLRGKPSAAKSWLKAIELTSRIEANPRRLFADVVEEWAARQPDRPGLLSDAETFSYRTLSERINRYARWALSVGIKAGDTVCLFMPGRPDYIAAWLGITKIGGVGRSSIPNWWERRCRIASTSRRRTTLFSRRNSPPCSRRPRRS